MTIVPINGNTYDTSTWEGSRAYIEEFPAMVNDVVAVAAEVATDASTASTTSVTGTSYTLLLTDAGKILECSNASAQAITIPTNASVAFPTGSIIIIEQHGAGAVTATGASGVTVNGVSEGSATLGGQYLGAYLRKSATNTWVLIGALV